MRNPTAYLKMRVLGAIDMAEGKTIRDRIKAVSQLTFTDEEGQPRQFTWKTISTWLCRYQKHGVTVMENKPRSDKGKIRKVPLEDVAEFAAAGKIRILGTTGEERSRFVPNVPTFQEQGFGEYARSVWIAVFAPAGTPDAVVVNLRKTLKQSLADPAVQAAMGRQLQKAQWGEPEVLNTKIVQERASWKKAVQALNFTPES